MSERSKPLITELATPELVQWCERQGQGAYRARQISHWIYEKRAASFAEMHDLPAVLRQQLETEFDLFGSTVARHLVSRDGTEKLLLELRDGEQTECVLMREEHRRTICISTQVGCGMGCVFCASGLLGVKRNLSTGEILDQVLRLDRLLPPGEKITNVVVMGMGEPLANLKALLPALLVLHDESGFGLGARRITVSTVGLPERIDELAAVGIPFNLAVSLHAPNDQLRNEIVPVNRNIGLDRILASAERYFEKTGRRVTYEYVLLSGVNDQDQHARELAALLRGRNAHVNLIPMNAVSSLTLSAPPSPRTRQFVTLLTSLGVNATVRKRKGADIDAACGQLRLNAVRDNQVDLNSTLATVTSISTP